MRHLGADHAREGGARIDADAQPDVVCSSSAPAVILLLLLLLRRAAQLLSRQKKAMRSREAELTAALDEMREKLRRETMSEKIFRDFRFTGAREIAARKTPFRLVPDYENK
jgi:hypothetical protein